MAWVQSLLKELTSHKAHGMTKKKKKKSIFVCVALLTFTYFYCFTRRGNGNPLQYSCLENPTDGGAWQAAVHGVAKSGTWLSNFTFTFHLHALEKAMATHSSALAWRIPGTGSLCGLRSMGSHRVGHDWSDLQQKQHFFTSTQCSNYLFYMPPLRLCWKRRHLLHEKETQSWWQTKLLLCWEFSSSTCRLSSIVQTLSLSAFSWGAIGLSSKLFMSCAYVNFTCVHSEFDMQRVPALWGRLFSPQFADIQ